MTPLQSLVETGTKLWLDSVDPDLVATNKELGATGATSNPIIIAELIKTGRFDRTLAELLQDSSDDGHVAWKMADTLVGQAQAEFASVHERTSGDDGYVSFELDPLLEDAACPLSTGERSAEYVRLGIEWSQGHTNRMIKIPALWSLCSSRCSVERRYR